VVLIPANRKLSEDADKSSEIPTPVSGDDQVRV